jgi:hypothetical protein
MDGIAETFGQKLALGRETGARWRPAGRIKIWCFQLDINNLDNYALTFIPKVFGL